MGARNNTDDMPTITRDRSSTIWSLGALAVAAWSCPFVVTYAFAIAFYRFLTRGKPSTPPPTLPTATQRKTAIITGGKMTKALCVARQLKAQGCRVIMLETHKYWMVASRFASCVDRFVTVPVPEQDPKAYNSAIKQLAYEEDADLFVPVSSPVASVYDAAVGKHLPSSCRSLSCGEVWTAMLDDKVTFNELARHAGLPVPETTRITSKEAAHAFNNELRAKGEHATKMIFKNLQYDSMRRLDLFTLPCEPTKLAAYMSDIDEISEKAPWVAQTFVSGVEHSTCAIAYEGALTMFTDNVASISCFNYKEAGEPKLRAWVEKFCKHHKISGVVCIDFFLTDEGTPLAIECNPRFSSNITNFYSSPTIGRAYVEPQACAQKGVTEVARPDHQETCWLGCELWYALTKPGLSPAQRLREVYDAFFIKKDAYWDADDVLPFLALYFLHIPVLLARNVQRGNKWAKIDLCIGKLTEVNGD